MNPDRIYITSLTTFEREAMREARQFDPPVVETAPELEPRFIRRRKRRLALLQPPLRIVRL